MHDLGKRIRALRKQRGMTQMQLADGICTAGLISQIERGLAYPSIKTLTLLAQRLGVSPSFLLEPDASTMPPAWMVEALEDIVQALEFREHTRALHRGLVTLERVYELIGDKDGALEAYQRAAEMVAHLREA